MATIDMTDRSRLHRKANEALDQNLGPDENVQVIITGPSNQAIIGTERRAFVYKKGFMAGASFGSELTTWDYRNLVGVQIHTGMMSGAVVLQSPGQSGTKTNVWKNGDEDPYKAPNAIPLNRPYEPAQEGVAILRQLIDVAQRSVTAPMAPPVQAATSVSLVDELKKLADLHAAGALTDEEFAMFKAHLITSVR
ncbi:SHOCT domain-containing protein [Blastococcus sp. SYSU DS1024]